MNRLKLFIILIISVIFTSCKNSDWSAPDFEYSTVYFAYQYPVRTIELGQEYTTDNSLDNEHKCQILATMSGVREVKNDVEIGFKVDNTLCSNLTNVKAMPSNYYSLSDNSKMVIKKGSKFMGGVVVSLTDAFFADKNALKTTYVIPLVMTDVKNADKILTGTPLSTVTNPNRVVSTDWYVLPKDYILYAVKFINPWDAFYLRRGTDNVTADGNGSVVVRHKQYVEKDEVVKLSSLSFTEVEFPLDYQSKAGVDLNLKVKLNFDSNQKCVVTPLVTDYNFAVSDTTSIRVFNIAATGQGEYKKNVDNWANKDRDALHLSYGVNYEVNFYEKSVLKDHQVVKYNTVDTLVLRDRGIAPEFFTPEF